MAFQRKTIALNNASGPISRAGDGEEFPLAASGGIFFDKVDGVPIFVRFDESPVLVPIYSGRSIDIAFKRFSIVHDPVHTGSIEIVVYQKGEGIFDAAALGAPGFSEARWLIDRSWPVTDGLSTAEVSVPIYFDVLRNGSPVDTYSSFLGSSTMGVVPKFTRINEEMGAAWRHPRMQYVSKGHSLNGPLAVKPTTLPPERSLVGIDSFRVAIKTLPKAGQYHTGIGYGLGPEGGLPWITGGNAMWGLFLEASDGKWHWVINTSGALPAEEDTVIEWPRALTDWVDVDVVHLFATPSRAAVVQLWLDGSKYLERNWEVGHILPTYGDRHAVNDLGIVCAVRVNDTDGAPNLVDLTFATWRRRIGKYDLSGTEITG